MTRIPAEAAESRRQAFPCLRPTLRRVLRCLAALAAAAAASRAMAQESVSVARVAADAFGQRVGNEQIGLYTEAQVRGFNLGDTGSYRLGGLYFVSESAPPDVILGGVGVRVGYNATGLLYPSPSGVVDYALADPSDGRPGTEWSFGVRDSGSPFLQVVGRTTPVDDVALRAGALLRPRLIFGDGTHGAGYAGGLAAQWAPAEAIRVRLVASGESIHYNGDYGVRSAVAPPPLEPEAGRNLGAPWAVSSRRNTNLGLLLDWADPQGAALRGGLFYSERSGGRADFTALRYDAAGVLHTSVLSVDHELGGSWSGELALSYPVTLLGHRIDVLLAARGRSSRHLLGASEIYDLDRQPPWTSAARPSTAAAASDGELDVTHQYSGALGFETSLPAGVRVHAEVHPSRYTKSVTGPAGGSTRVQSDLLYNASLLWSPDGQTTLYASYARGLEGSGVAPQDAQNANAVLPAVLTREAEVGFRRSLGPNLRLIGSAFSVAKPRPGRDAANVYTFIGDVRHAGVELSLNGEIAQGTSMLAGVTIMRPRLSGPLVAAGLVGPRPVGIPSASAVFSIDHTFSRSPNTSVDAQLNWESGRTANLANSATTPGYALLNLGLRRRFSFGSSKAAFRLTIGNVTGSRGWVATPGGGFQTRPERTLRFALLMNGRD